MADSEKLTALKKAYADIILNTAKEAAARIMVSERKAQRYQCELFAAKDEALRMLLRLKQMLDSKVNEAETASLNQQRKIEELEAQLGEAEDIVKDLRAELSELQDQLEKVASNQMQHLNESISEAAISTQVAALDGNRLNSASGFAVRSSPAPQCDSLVTLQLKDSNLNGIYNANKGDNGNGSHKDDCFLSNPDFASIVMRSKEPELYRNGCTQRIRAFERNVLGGNLSASEHANDTRNRMFVREDVESKQICEKPAPMANKDEIKLTQANGNCIKVQDAMSFGRKKKGHTGKQADGNCIQVHDVKSFRTKRKRGTRKHRSPLFKSFPDQDVNSDVQSMRECFLVKNISQNDADFPLASKSTSNTNEVIMQSGLIEVSESHAEFGSPYLVQNRTNGDQLSLDEQRLIRREAGSPNCSDFPASKTDSDVASVSSVIPDPKEPEATEVLVAQPMNDKFLKYTFQRKRKREAPSSPDSDSFVGSSTLKIKMGKQNSPLDSTSRDSQRLAQVACQLISLSGKERQ